MHCTDPEDYKRMGLELLGVALGGPKIKRELANEINEALRRGDKVYVSRGTAVAIRRAYGTSPSANTPK